MSEQPRDQLETLNQTERSLSRRRTVIHSRIELLLASRDEQECEAQLDGLRQEEAEVSRERRELHRRIDELRAQLGMPSWSEERARRRPMLG